MMRAPRANLAKYLPESMQAAPTVVTRQQLVPQATLNPELLRQAQEEVMTPEESMWATQKLMPMQAPTGSGAFKATRLNLFRATPPLYLQPGQEKNPMWIQANQDVEDFRKLHGFPKATIEELTEIELAADEIFSKQIHPFLQLQFTQEQYQRKIQIEQEIKMLLEKHGIHPKTIPVYFISSKAEKELHFVNAWAGVIGRSLIIFERGLECSPQEMTALLEHEIGHLVSHDSAYLKILNRLADKGQIDSCMIPRYTLLTEKRADIHSGIQSTGNVKGLCSKSDYAPSFKFENIVRNLAMTMPIFLKMLMVTPEFVDLNEPLPAAVATKKAIHVIKKIANQEYEIGKINSDELQEIIKICDQPTYLDDLLVYHAQQVESESVSRDRLESEPKKVVSELTWYEKMISLFQFKK